MYVNVPVREEGRLIGGVRVRGHVLGGHVVIVSGRHFDFGCRRAEGIQSIEIDVQSMDFGGVFVSGV